MAEDTGWTPDPEEKKIERDELAVTISSSALTSTTQSLSVLFRSKKVEAFPNSSRMKNVYIVPLDPKFDLTTAQNAAEEEKAAKTAAGEEFTPVVYESAVYNIVYNKSAPAAFRSKIVIPSSLTYAGVLEFRVTTINANCVFNKDGVLDYQDLTEIVIPETITTIQEDAFAEAPDDFIIRCEGSEFVDSGEVDEEEQPIYVKRYDTEFSPVPVQYESPLTEDEKKYLDVTAGASKEYGDGADFFLGYKDDKYDYPMYMEYSFERFEGGETTPIPGTYYMPLDVTSPNNPYNAVGTSMGNDDYNAFITINVEDNIQINPKSIVFHNIYRVIRSTDQSSQRAGSFVPDLSRGQYYSVPAIGFDWVPNFSEFLTLTPDSFSTLGSFLQFQCLVERVRLSDGFGVYPLLNNNLFLKNKAALEAGTLTLRYQFSALDAAKYIFTVSENGAVRQIVVPVRTPITYVHIPEKGNLCMGFLVDTANIEGLKYENLQKVELSGFTVKLDIYDPAKNAIVTKSSTGVRFGNLTLFDNPASARRIDLASALVWGYVIYVVVYVAIVLGYYFYAKRAFRNDEFRRMNNKRYIVAAIKNFLGCAFVFSAIAFISARWGVMRTTVVTFNPLDAFVALFSVVAAIYIGFTIKNFVVSIKNAKKRKEAARLKLDEDLVDDGTH